MFAVFATWSCTDACENEMNGIWKEIWQILLAIKFENKEKYEKKYAPGGFEPPIV